MAANPIPTIHSTECISEAVSVMRTWHDAVREVNTRPTPERKHWERECYAEMATFHPDVIEAAESYLSRWSA